MKPLIFWKLIHADYVKLLNLWPMFWSLHVLPHLLLSLEILYPVKALPRIPEIEPLLKDICFLQSVKRIPDSPGGQIAFPCYFFLGKQSAFLKYLKNKLCGWRKSLELHVSVQNRYVLCYITAFRGGKDDSSLVVTGGVNGVNWDKGFYIFSNSEYYPLI